MPQFVAVPSEAIESLLRKKGFTRTTQRDEVVYIKRSGVNYNLMLKVYTSISVSSSVVRGVGKDALRCCVVFDDGVRSFGVGKFPPIFRVTSVESVLERLNIRIREASLRAREWLTQQDANNVEALRDLEQKNRFAEKERAQEQQAYLNDMQQEQDPPSERPDAYDSITPLTNICFHNQDMS